MAASATPRPNRADAGADPAFAPLQALELPIEAKQAWTDVARLTQRDIPAVNFGPGETAQAHQANESIPIEYLIAGYEALERLFA